MNYLIYLNEHNKTIVLLDYNTNCDLYNLSSPLSHASLIKEFVESRYTKRDSKNMAFKESDCK